MFGAYAELYGCSETAEIVYKKGDVWCIQYEDCEHGTTLRHCVAEGGGHNWPGCMDLYDMNPDMNWWAAPNTTEDMDASLEMWKFFTEHPLSPPRHSSQICSTLGSDLMPESLDEDVFTFQGVQNESITLLLEKDSTMYSPGKWATLKLESNNYSVKDHFSRIDMSTLPNHIHATLPATGQYTVTVKEQPRLKTRSPIHYCLDLKSKAGNLTQEKNTKIGCSFAISGALEDGPGSSLDDLGFLGSTFLLELQTYEGMRPTIDVFDSEWSEATFQLTSPSAVIWTPVGSPSPFTGVFKAPAEVVFVDNRSGVMPGAPSVRNDEIQLNASFNINGNIWELRMLFYYNGAEALTASDLDDICSFNIASTAVITVQQLHTYPDYTWGSAYDLQVNVLQFTSSP
jgi:hypothetical protein